MRAQAHSSRADSIVMGVSVLQKLFLADPMAALSIFWLR